MIRRTLVAAAAAAALAAGLAGCASPALEDEAGSQLQGSVVDVAQAAASGDVAGALVQLDEVEAQLDAAVEADAVTAARAARIQSAIDAVRTDLEALAAPEPVTTPTEPPPTPVDQGNQGGGNENSGPGNNNGNGNGNGNGNSGKDKKG
jgi:ribosomal protein S20